MMKITVLCVGQIKERYLREALAEYAKRLTAYCKLSFIEVADERTPEGAAQAQCKMILEKEAGRLEKRMDQRAYTIALAIAGRKYSSEDFAAKIQDLAVKGISHIQFVIGGSLGLSDSILKHSDLQLSFSDMTFPHQLMRVILLEQIYRSYKINSGEPYHK